jgi:hypothetical protein
MNSLLKDSLLGLKDKLEILEKEFETKLTDSTLKEQKIKDIDAKIEELKDTKDAIINLNIGGKIFKTKTSTLLAFKDSLFYRLVGTNVEKGTEVPKDIFIDRSYTHFPKILDYLRTKQLSLKGFNKFDKQDILDELEYYGLDNEFQKKKNEIEIGWDQGLSKAGECDVNPEDNKIMNVHSRSCYCHFVTNKTFNTEDFQITLESTVTQTDNYYYIGVMNETYSYTGNCGCCNPANAYYIQCDGSTHINATRTENPTLRWGAENVTVTLKVSLSKKQITFVVDGKGEAGPFTMTGNTFRVYAGHCNTGNGQITITECIELDD